MSDFANVVWVMLSFFLFAAYIVVMLQIVVDLFRDPQLGGGAKALWILGLIFLPILTALVYIVSRGKGMAQRQRLASERARVEGEEYIRHVAGSTSVDQIARAKSLLDSGVITTDEFAAIKRGALAGATA